MNYDRLATIERLREESAQLREEIEQRRALVDEDPLIDPVDEWRRKREQFAHARGEEAKRRDEQRRAERDRCAEREQRPHRVVRPLAAAGYMHAMGATDTRQTDDA
jgi:hypothetical protein